MEPVLEAVQHIEEHLYERLGLEELAAACRYSPYHLHRMFARTVGMPPHTYARRRRLTEAARSLIRTDRSIGEIALETGYASQQAFTAAFTELYKCSPAAFRWEGRFWPLQFPFEKGLAPKGSRQWRLRRMGAGDLRQCLALVRQTVDGFPHWEEEHFLAALEERMGQDETLILLEEDVLVGALAFSGEVAHVGFMSVRPEWRGQGAAAVLLERLEQQLPGRRVSITTFRPADPADTGWRKSCESMGFIAGEELTEFGYPTQRLFREVKA